MNQQYELMNNYIIVKDQILGSGLQSQVYLGKHILTNEYVAVKKIKKDNEIVKQFFIMEVNILSKCKELKMENIIQMIDSFETKTCYIIVLELCEQSLRKYLQTVGSIHEKQAVDWMLQIVKGMTNLHSLQFSHRDLKPENIVIKDDKLKIIDLSFGKSLQQEAKSIIGSIGYMAPEMKIGHYSSLKADIYSLGVIFYEMVYGNRDFTFINGTVHPKVKDLILLMLDHNPKDRINWQPTNLALLTLQQLLSDNELQLTSFILQDSKLQQDIDFLNSIIFDCLDSPLSNQDVSIPCAVLILKLAIQQIQNQLEKEQQLENQLEKEQFVNEIVLLNQSKEIHTEYLEKYITRLQDLKKQPDQPEIIREMFKVMDGEFDRSPSYNFQFIYKKQIQYLFNFIQRDLLNDISDKNKLQLLIIQIKLLIAFDYENDFVIIQTLLQNANFEVDIYIIEFFQEKLDLISSQSLTGDALIIIQSLQQILNFSMEFQVE